MSMYANMKKLITAKFYNTAEEAMEKLDVFFAVGRLTVEEYMELVQLVDAVYNPPIEQPTEEPTTK